MTTKLYTHLASLVQARLNCIESQNDEWLAKHQDRIESLVKEYLPSGSGFDSGTKLDLEEDAAMNPAAGVPELSEALTPQQAMNNFKLFLELSPRNSYAEYRAAVREIAETCLATGIQGDDKNPTAARRALIEVTGGVAEVTQCPPDVDVEIVDHDNEEHQ
jgi:hypothetical protein